MTTPKDESVEVEVDVPIDRIGQHELSPTLKALAKRGWTTANARFIRSGNNADWLTQVVDAEMVRQGLKLPSNLVIVPDLLAVDLTALAAKELRLTHLDSDYGSWDYYRDLKGGVIEGRGLTLEYFVWTPGKRVTSNEVRVHFKELRCFGHTGAFSQWLRKQTDLQGFYATIPEDSACSLGPDGNLGVPYFYSGGGYRKLLMDPLGADWGDGWSFVGFRVFSV